MKFLLQPSKYVFKYACRCCIQGPPSATVFVLTSLFLRFVAEINYADYFVCDPGDSCVWHVHTVCFLCVFTVQLY